MNCFLEWWSGKDGGVGGWEEAAERFKQDMMGWEEVVELEGEILLPPWTFTHLGMFHNNFRMLSHSAGGQR